jgi:hypothetical protein
MNPKPALMAAGLLAMTLVALAPTVAASPTDGPDADIIVSPSNFVTCATVPRTIPVTPDLTLNVRSDCGVEVHYDGHNYLCRTVPRTITITPGVSVTVTQYCNVIVNAWG